MLPDYAFGRGDAGRRDRQRAAPARRAVPRRRAGAFLSRRPDRARDPGRGRRHARLFLDAASRPRCSTWSPACSTFPDAYVTCETRRMGGGFGGKESQATQWAVTAALAARVTGRPCKLRLDRDDDFILTGKRHDFRCDWSVGFDDGGPDPGLRGRASRALRLFGRPLRRRRRPRDVPFRQCLLDAGRHDRLASG